MTISDCDEALKGRLASAKVGGRIVVGRCQEIGVRPDAVSWSISPNRELLTSLASAKPPVTPVPVDVVTTDSIPSADEGAASDYTTVLVTHGMGSDAVTTSHIVKRSN